MQDNDIQKDVDALREKAEELGYDMSSYQGRVKAYNELRPGRSFIKDIVFGSVVLIGIAGVCIYLIFSALFAGKSENQPTSLDGRGTTVPAQTTPDIAQDFVLRIMAYGPEELADTALAARSAGHACSRGISVEQVYQNNRAQPIFRLSCENNEFYQMTIIGERVFVKTWTGIIIGR